MVPSAYLRVFQPLDGFERSEQLHWERWLVTGRGQAGRPRFADRPTGQGVGFLAPGGREAAEVRAFEGRTYRAPPRPRLRVLTAGAEDPEESLAVVGPLLLRAREARRARRELGKLR